MGKCGYDSKPSLELLYYKYTKDKNISRAMLLMPDKGFWFPLSVLPIRKQLLILLVRNGSKPATHPCVRHRLLLPLNSELNDNRSSAS